MDVIWTELKAIPDILLGLAIMFVGCLISDIFTEFINNAWKKTDS